MKDIFSKISLVFSFFFSQSVVAQWTGHSASPGAFQLNGAYVLNSTNAWVTGNNGNIFKWNGSSFSSQSVGGMVSQRFCIWMANVDFGYIGGGSGSNQLMKYDGGKLKISFPTRTDFELIDSNGRLVKKQLVQAGLQEISVDGLSRGWYILKCGSESKKIVIR